MDNLFTYIKWRGDLTFEMAPFNEVDNLVFANLTYVRLKPVMPDNIEISVKDAYAKFIALPKEKQLCRDPKDIRFFNALANTLRYQDIVMINHEENYSQKDGIQFAAMTYRLNKNTYYVAFRGTDKALIGWKEDLDLAFKVVPAQKAAKAYLLKIIRHFPKARFYVGGHSKGGNLAVYAASFIPKAEQKKIIEVFNNDGPGFDKDLVKMPKIDNIINKISNYVPQSSMIYVLFEAIGKEFVISSFKSGIMQHDPYSWEINGSFFKRAKSRNKTSEFVKQTIKTWLDNIPHTERETSIEGIFKIIFATKAENIEDIIPGIFKNFADVQKTLSCMDEKTKTAIQNVLDELFKALGQSFPLLWSNFKSS